MWRSLRVFGLTLAVLTVATALLYVTEVIAVPPMTVLLLAVLTLSVLALYLNFRNRRNSAS